MPATLEHHDSLPRIGPPHPWLVVLEVSNPEHVGETFVLDRARMRFGRSATCIRNEIVLFQDEYMSRGVGWFERRDDGQWWVVDNGSTCGVYVNSEKVEAPIPGKAYCRAQPLGDGDRVRIGGVTLEFRVPCAPTA